MWEGFRWRSSETRYDHGRGRRGRLWSALHHLFGPHRTRRMHLDPKNNRDTGFKYQKLEKDPSSIAKEQFSDAGASSLFDDGNGSIEMVSDGTYTKAVELQMKQHNEQKILPVNPARMMRILSIHHLKCDDYVQSDRKVSHNYNDGSCQANTGQIHPGIHGDMDEDNSYNHNPFEELRSLLLQQEDLFQEKLNEAKVAMMNHQDANFIYAKGGFSENKANKFLDALEVFHANREKFLKVLEDPNYLTMDYILDRGSLGVSPVLSRAVSCPGSGSSGGSSGASSNRKKDTGSFVNQDGKMQPDDFPSTSETNITTKHDKKLLKMKQGDLHSVEPYVTTLETRNSKALHHLKDANKRITLDGILDKIPVDQKEGSTRERYIRKGSSGGEWTASVGDSCFRRSHSLSDSMDRYSRLLETNPSRGFYGHASNRFQPTQVDGASHTKQNASKTLGRIYSLPEYHSYPLKFTSNDDSHAIKPPRTTSPELDLTSSAVSYTSNYQGRLETPVIPPNEDLIGAADTTNMMLIPENQSHDSVTDLLYKSVNVNSTKVSDELEIISEEEVRSNMSYDQEIRSGIEDTGSLEVTHPGSPEILLDGELTYTAKFPNVQEVTEDGDPSEGGTNVHDDSDTSGMKIVNTPPLREFDLDTLRIGVQSEDVASFNYVMDILKMSGFNNSELQGRWHSPELPLDTSILKELEGISSEKEVCSCVVELNLHNLLLFDLTNEVLLEIYETNSVSHMQSSRFPSRIRCTYEGLVFLKEVWANVSWCLSSQPQVNPETDDIVSLDFKRNVGWMDWIYQVEGIGMELEEMIIDDVLDETVHESLNFISF